MSARPSLPVLQTSPGACAPVEPAEPADLGRRGFLGLAGASLALAGLDACIEAPREKILPYTRSPEGLVPGRPLHYATAHVRGGFATGLVVESHEGRPTKVEGNPDHPSSLGASGAIEQALILGLYHPDRVRGPTYRGEPRAISSFLEWMAARGATSGHGEGLWLLLEPGASPFLGHLRQQIATRFPGSHIGSWMPLDRDQVYDGARLAFGRPVDTHHRLEAVDVLLAIDCDLLCHGPDALRHARAFAGRRTPAMVGGSGMARLYAVETRLSVTGAFADHRLALRQAEILPFTLELVAALARRPEGAALRHLGIASAGRTAWIDALAGDLARSRGRCAVAVGGRQPPVVHALAHAIHQALGATGTAVRHTGPILHDIECGPGALQPLVEAARRGEIRTLVVTAGDPVHTAPADLDLPAVLRAIPEVVHLTAHPDATARVASWVVPAAHELESWGDARAFDGSVSLVQPLIAPLHGGITEAELLAALLGEIRELGESAHALLQQFWRAERPGPDFQERWERWLARGLVEDTASPIEQPELRWDAIAAQIHGPPAAVQAGLELSFVPDAKLEDGRYARNAWLQELPDPITKVTWDTVAMISPATAGRMGLAEGDVVRLTAAGRRIEVPICLAPGQAEETVVLPLGACSGGEVNPYALRTAGARWSVPVLAEATGKRQTLAVTHSHWTMEGRKLAFALTADQLAGSPDILADERAPLPELYHFAGTGNGPYRWAMAIDTGRCTGCSACVIACQAENNIPSVGRDQVLRGREMHWIRIDRYFEGNLESPTVINQPVACVHCEMAPCEYVCPVNATVHSEEGLNEMVYNRCIGTRYCSNNCPYKVRRFNWLDWHRDLTPSEELGMNPEVTVRSRGVMEKCTYCVQRIERARIDTRIAHQEITDGMVTPACAQACPTQAITFGMLSDPSSRVSVLHRDPRRYDLLNELGTRPRTVHLARIRNPNPALAST